MPKIGTEEIATWLEELVAYLKETYILWDSDKDMKVGKRLRWLCGGLPGYEPDKLSPREFIQKLRTQTPESDEPDSADLYYVQDNRSYCGNDVKWWAKDGHGYTTDLSQAHVFTLAEVERLDRDCDVAWPKAYVDERTRPAVDIQRLEPDQAITREKRRMKTHG